MSDKFGARARRIVIDTDMGVDDAMAIAWLLVQAENPIEISAISTVWGNTSIENATANAAALLAALGRNDVALVSGCDAPLVRKRTAVGRLAHGPDGLWGCAKGSDVSRARSDVAAFYRSFDGEGATLLALGPLTNLATALMSDASALSGFERIVILGGARSHGAMTPVSETNFWHDPEAADAVMSAGLPITLVTRDAHREFVLSRNDIATLESGRSAASGFLAAPARRYADATERFGEALNYPDIVAAVLALDPTVAKRVERALVRVIRGSELLTRGQSIIGVTANERLTMIDGGSAVGRLIEEVLPNASVDPRDELQRLLATEPPTADVVLEIDAHRVRTTFLRGICAEVAAR